MARRHFTRKSITWNALFALLSLATSPALGQKMRYVSPHGSDKNPGTAKAPFQTIGKAASVVNPGDTVIVESGIYHEALNLTRSGTAQAYVTFKSRTKWGAVLDGNRNALAEAVQFTASYIRFQGFEIRGYGADGSADAFSNYPGGQFLVIAQNYIHDIGRLCTSTTNGLVGVFLEAPNVLIEQNLFADIGRYAPGENGCSPRGDQYQNHDHGIYLDTNSNHVTIKNNVFYRIERGWGVQVYPSGLDSLAILNNTFLWPNPYRTGQIIIAGQPMTNLRIENNISYRPAAAFIRFSSDNVSGTIARNLISKGAVGDAAPRGVTFADNFTDTDPLLVNPGNAALGDPVMADAHLMSGSPAIGAGLALAEVSDDFDEKPRPNGHTSDIGAFQFRAPASGPLRPERRKSKVK